MNSLQVWGKLTYIVISTPNLQPAPQFEVETLFHIFSSQSTTWVSRVMVEKENSWVGEG